MLRAVQIKHVKCQLSVSDECRTVHSGVVTVNHSRLTGRPAGASSECAISYDRALLRLL